jgi:GNAT superfamily N-acetyltransferase
MITTRLATAGDIPSLVSMLTAFMKEAFDRPWSGSPEALARDGLGQRFQMMAAVAGSAPDRALEDNLVGFAAWQPHYDLHHCLWGGEVIDMYVGRRERGRGVALVLLASIAAHVREGGGSFVMGQSVPDPRVQRMYERLAVSFPGASCYVGGRAFRALAELRGAAPRTIARGLPDRAWNHEP